MKTMKNGWLVKRECDMPKGRRMNRLVRAVPALVIVMAIGHLAAASVEARPLPEPTHRVIGNAVGAVQATVNDIDTNVDDIQSTLDQIPPAWSQVLPADQRFQLVIDGAAVLDKETGLVWEQSPTTTSRAWLDALWQCLGLSVAGRLGWRLPMVQELASLVDAQSNPTLPAGHPFSNVQSAFYWSATSDARNATNALGVNFNTGVPMNGGGNKSTEYHVWCVRGGQGVDPQ